MPTEPPDDPCEKLRWAAEMQAFASAKVRQAAQLGKQLVDKLYGEVNTNLTAQDYVVGAYARKLNNKATSLQRRGSGIKNKLVGKIVSAAVPINQQLSSIVTGLQGKIAKGLDADGKILSVLPGLTPPPPGTLAAGASPTGGFLYSIPAPTTTLATLSPTQSVADTGVSAPAPVAPGSDGVSATSTPSGAVPVNATGVSYLDTIQAQADATVTSTASLAAILPPEVLAAPVQSVSLDAFAAALCHCLGAAHTELPVDLDQPNAMLFGQRAARWHGPAAKFYGPDMERVFTALTLESLLSEREEADRQWLSGQSSER